MHNIDLIIPDIFFLVSLGFDILLLVLNENKNEDEKEKRKTKIKTKNILHLIFFGNYFFT
jgi:hypothetical protein